MTMMETKTNRKNELKIEKNHDILRFCSWMSSWSVWCITAAEGSEVPRRAHFGCTDIYTIHVAYFTHCGIFFQIKFHFKGCETRIISCEGIDS